MALFQVTTLAPTTAALNAAISQLPQDDVYVLPNNSGWLVKYAGTSRELSVQLGLEADPPSANAVLVLSVSGYWGRAQQSLWQWIASRMQ